MKELTPKQAEILVFLKTYSAEHQRPPAIREIAKEFGFSSTHGVSCHLDRLIAKGYVRRDPLKSRGLVILDVSEGEVPVAPVTRTTPDSLALRRKLASVLDEARRLERAIAALEER
jgi:SOS-response transcriptional repressor LexA